MKNENERPKLEIVRTPQRDQVQADDFIEANCQANLFPSPKRGLLILVYFPDVTDEEFRNVLRQAKPALILELRTAPRFDIGTLDRSSAFKLFLDQESKYIDLSSKSMGAANEYKLVGDLESFLKNSSLSVERPIMILLNRPSSISDSVSKKIRASVLSALPEIRDVFELPRFYKLAEPQARSASH